MADDPMCKRIHVAKESSIVLSIPMDGIQVYGILWRLEI
jgi:hypothetical protein